MKTRLLILIIAISSLFHFNKILAQETAIKSKVDERTELLSIVFRLIGAQEYNVGAIKSYNNDIDTYFAGFKDHEVMQLAKEYRKNFGVGYDAVMSVAIHINIVDSSIQINNSVYNNLERRWTKERLELFVEKLSDFYQKTEFRKFFEAHSELYSMAQNAMDDILETKMDFTWFDRFFGKKSGNYHIIVNLVNGRANYGPNVIHNDKTEDMFAIIGTDSSDGKTPEFTTAGAVSLIVHEICHSYCNPLIYKHIDELKKSGEIIYPYISKKMQAQAYGNWTTVLCEALVRASVICYIEQDTILDLKVENFINSERNNGFFWITGLIEKMKEYEANKDKYTDWDSYMPQIVSFYDELATEAEKQTELFSKIIYSSIDNNSRIPYNTNELIFKFSKPMDTKRGYGFGYSKGGKDRFPKIENTEWIDDKTIKLTLNLEQGKMYSLQLYTPAYLDTEGYPVLDNYSLEFETESE